MHPVEIQQCLDSFSIIYDSREQPTKKAFKRYESFEVPAIRHKLEYGDYTYNATLPSGEKIFDETNRIYPDVCIERKESLNELSYCFCQSRDRFEREMERATEHGARIYLLVENATYENLLNGKYKTKFHPEAFSASLFAWVARYGIVPVFCKAETSGKIIKHILYRELKERLVNGQYDK